MYRESILIAYFDKLLMASSMQNFKQYAILIRPISVKYIVHENGCVYDKMLFI